MRNEDFDYLVIGAGMAGASAAFELAATARVCLLEREPQPGYHSTGRSVALYSEIYGNATIRALTTGGRRFFREPPAGFADHPLLSPRGALFFGDASQSASLGRILVEGGRLVDSLRALDGRQVQEMVPVLRPERALGGVLEPEAMDIDVNALHQGYLRGLRARGGAVRTDADGLRMTRRGERWHVRLDDGEVAAPVLVNAAGAWADEVAAAAGVTSVGLVPKRRTVITFAAPADVDAGRWPMVLDADERFYFKPEAGKLLASPADETPVDPCDVQPEEIDVAICVDRIETATTMQIRRVERRWAGLRSFVADRSPVVGFDPAVEGFFWLAGQGGYGIQTAPGLGRAAAALAARRPLPADLADLGVAEAALSPARLRTAAA